MSDEEDFEEAQRRVRKLRKTPAQDELLSLYALYKQASMGDVSGPRPGILDFKGRAKFDAWQNQRGKARDEARRQYTELVAALERKYGSA